VPLGDLLAQPPAERGALLARPGGELLEPRSQLLGRLVTGDESDAPQITTAADWHVGFEP